MITMEDDGLFWLPEEPDRRVAGHLRLDRDAGGELVLIGKFGDPSDFTDDDEPERYPRILGVAGKRTFTLEDCLIINSTFMSVSGESRRLVIARALIGAHFGHDEELRFTAIAVETNHLHEWVGRSGLERSMQTEGNRLTGAQLNYKLPDTESVEIENGQLSLGFTYAWSGDDLKRTVLDQGSFLKLDMQEMVDLDGDLMEFVGAVRDLITIGVDSPSETSAIHLWHPDLIDNLDGQEVQRSINLWFKRGGNAKIKERILQHQMLFSYRQVGGISGIANWLSVYQRYRPVLGALMGSRYVNNMFTENRFQNMVNAAETFHRLRFSNQLRPKREYRAFRRSLVEYVPEEHRSWLSEQLQFGNEPRLKTRLKEMAEYAGTPFAVLVADTEKWCETVKAIRNRLTHRDKDSSAVADSTTLYWLSESAFFLVVLCLLKECSFGGEVSEGIINNQRFQWTAERVEEVLANSQH